MFKYQIKKITNIKKKKHKLQKKAYTKRVNIITNKPFINFLSPLSHSQITPLSSHKQNHFHY